MNYEPSMDHQLTPPAFMLRFDPLSGVGPALSFPCDEAGRVNLDSLWGARTLQLLLCTRRDRTPVRNACRAARRARVNTRSTAGRRQASRLPPSRHAHGTPSSRSSIRQARRRAMPPLQSTADRAAAVTTSSAHSRLAGRDPVGPRASSPFAIDVLVLTAAQPRAMTRIRRSRNTTETDR